MFETPADWPKKELFEAVFISPARDPKNELLNPDILPAPAVLPKNALCWPVELAAPAPTPAKTLAGPEVPKTRDPEVLNCNADSVPPMVASPVIFKLAGWAATPF